MDAEGINYIALTKFPSLYEQGARGERWLVGVTAALLGVADSTYYFVRFLTLDVATGGQLGADAYVGIPSAVGSPVDPSRIIYSEFVLPGEVLVLGSDLQLARIPVSIGADNTPLPSPPSLIPQIGLPETLGKGRALAELTGAAFADGKPRLFVGTATGKVLVLVRSLASGGTPVVEKILNVTAGAPISDLGAIPQLNQIDLGVSSGSTLYGLRAQDGSYQVDFHATTGDGSPIFAFKLLNRPDLAITSGLGRAAVAYSDGYTATIHFASIAADAEGALTIDTAYTASGLTTDYAKDPSMIYILRTGESKVLFRPGYLDGSSIEGCAVDVVDDIMDECTGCPIWMTGDLDLSGTIAATDLIRLVKYVFQGGPPPEPCPAAADVDCSGKVDAKDVVYLIKYTLMNGPPPCNVCTLFNGTWECPSRVLRRSGAQQTLSGRCTHRPAKSRP